MDNKSTRLAIILGIAGAAVVALFATIWLIISNPSRIPQAASITVPPTPTQIPEIVIVGGQTSETGLQEVLTKAREELSKTSGATRSAISVTTATETTWPDSSLGCPKPGMFYTQVLTPGYQVVLTVSGKQYDYHADSSKNIMLCDRPLNQ